MQLVREHINFQRGLDPKLAMGTGASVAFKEFLEKELSWNDARVTINNDGTFTYCCLPGNSMYKEIKEAALKFGWDMKVLTIDGYSRHHDDGAREHEYLISPKKSKTKKKLTETQHFQRGLDPKRAMGIGSFTNIKPRMNGVIANEMESEAMFGYLRYIETAEWRDQVDEDTGEVGWPYIHIEVEIVDAPKARTSMRIKKGVKSQLEYIFKKLGIEGKVESDHSIYEYHFYPK